MENPPRIVIIIAPGFEEIEAVSIIDVLRRAGFEVIIAGLGSAREVRGAHDITLMADLQVEQLNGNDIDLLVLPGGMPGAQNLSDSKFVCGLIRQIYNSGKLIAAICAAPMALHRAGILQGRQVTCYPSFREKLTGAKVTDALVQCDGNIITSQGPGTALLFALELVRALGTPEKAEQLKQAMLI